MKDCLERENSTSHHTPSNTPPSLSLHLPLFPLPLSLFLSLPLSLFSSLSLPVCLRVYISLYLFTLSQFHIFQFLSFLETHTRKHKDRGTDTRTHTYTHTHTHTHTPTHTHTHTHTHTYFLPLQSANVGKQGVSQGQRARTAQDRTGQYRETVEKENTMRNTS